MHHIGKYFVQYLDYLIYAFGKNLFNLYTNEPYNNVIKKSNIKKHIRLEGFFFFNGRGFVFATAYNI